MVNESLVFVIVWLDCCCLSRPDPNFHDSFLRIAIVVADTCGVVVSFVIIIVSCHEFHRGLKVIVTLIVAAVVVATGSPVNAIVTPALYAP